MEYKVLEQNGIENENVDGAAFNNFCAGDRDCIIKGILNECEVYSPASNSIAIGTGEIIIKGFRVKITDPYIYSFVANAGVAIRYHIVAILTLSLDRSVTISIICRPVKNLVKDEIFKVEQGIYELELVRFTHTSTGITDIVKTVDVIAGCSAKSSGIIIGNVKTENIPAEMEAEVDVENVIRNGRTETDFTFSIPKSSITVDNLLLLDSENPVQNKVVAEALGGKLDKITTKGSHNRLYGVSWDGKQFNIKESPEPDNNSIAERTPKGQLKAKTLADDNASANDNDLTNRAYVAEKLEGKLDKQIPTEYKSVVAVHSNGEESLIPIIGGALPNSIAQRTSGGEIFVQTPSTGHDSIATNKGFVKKQIELAKEEIKEQEWKTATVTTDYDRECYIITLDGFTEYFDSDNPILIKGYLVAYNIERDGRDAVTVDCIAGFRGEVSNFSGYCYLKPWDEPNTFRVTLPDGNRIMLPEDGYTDEENKAVIKYKKF